jgi:hypothetical protein
MGGGPYTVLVYVFRYLRGVWDGHRVRAGWRIGLALHTLGPDENQEERWRSGLIACMAVCCCIGSVV